MLTDTTRSPHAKVHPLPGDAVRWTDGFYRSVEDTNARATVPELLSMFESSDISHIVENFRICAGEAQGSHAGTVFGDGDFYKCLEAATHIAVKSGNQPLLERIEDYISLIGRAQQEDGYLSTKQILGEREGNGVHRMGDINDFEVYNFGHLFTAAALHVRLTGRDSFLKIAMKTADYLERMYEEAKRKDQVQTAVCPSHYMGLVELYRATGDKKYLRLAGTAIELRDSVKNGLDDNQDRLPLKKHRRIIGHAVRATYLYAGVADLCLEEGDEELLEVLHSVWEDLISSKIYITGGVGALYNGASPYGNFFEHQLVHQAFGYAYELPNITAYNETCAGVGLVLWAYRMFLLSPEARYFDIIERAVLNTNLAAVSLDGLRFFYENMLERTEKTDYQLVWPLHRTDYITSYCCPPNLARLLAELTEYVYTVSEKDEVFTVYTGLYGASRARITLPDGRGFLLVQETDYPWDGRIRFRTEPLPEEAASQDSIAAAELPSIRLALRIPAWAESGCIEIRDGEERIRIDELPASAEGCYEVITLKNAADFEVTLTLDMPVRLTAAHPMVEADRGRAAVERGPLVYCQEAEEMPEGVSVQELCLIVGEEWIPKHRTIETRELVMLEGTMLRVPEKEEKLYRTLGKEKPQLLDTALIPYFAWNNRKPDKDREMAVYFPVNYGYHREEMRYSE